MYAKNPLVFSGILGFVYRKIIGKQITYIHIANAKCEILGLVYRKIIGKQMTYIHIANAKCEKFLFRSLHDIQSRLAILQRYCEIKVQSQRCSY